MAIFGRIWYYLRPEGTKSVGGAVHDARHRKPSHDGRPRLSLAITSPVRILHNTHHASFAVPRPEATRIQGAGLEEVEIRTSASEDWLHGLHKRDGRCCVCQLPLKLCVCEDGVPGTECVRLHHHSAWPDRREAWLSPAPLPMALSIIHHERLTRASSFILQGCSTLPWAAPLPGRQSSHYDAYPSPHLETRSVTVMATANARNPVPRR